MFFITVFFFKQKTAYDMRISDWSSDVCSSDLTRRQVHGQWLARRAAMRVELVWKLGRRPCVAGAVGQLHGQGGSQVGIGESVGRVAALAVLEVAAACRSRG